jgi:cytochrome c
MDSWYMNKVAGAVLSAVLLAFGAGTLADIIIPHGKPGKPGYVLPEKDAPTGPAVAAAPAFNFADLVPLIKTASPDDGRAAFAACRACHTVDKGGRALVGPNLWGVMNRDIAAHPDFPRYSAALRAQKGPWTWEKLATFLHDPRGTIPNNQMAYAGVKSNQDLAGLVVYLRSLSDSPVPLPN